MRHRRAVEVVQHVVDERELAVEVERRRERVARPTPSSELLHGRGAVPPRPTRRAGRGRAVPAAPARAGRSSRAGAPPRRLRRASRAALRNRAGPRSASDPPAPRTGAGRRVPPADERRRSVLAVAAEELVGALARQRHGDVLRRRAATGRGSRAPRGRRAARRGARRGRRGRRVWSRKESSSSWCSVPKALATSRASASSLPRSSSREADGERLHRLGHVPRHQRDDQARVEAAAQHRAERHVAHQPQPDRLLELLEELLPRARPRQTPVTGLRAAGSAQ